MRTTDLTINKIPKSVGYWLVSGALLVVMMVILGGYTRLSHSGLSIVTWKPVTGFIPPMSTTEWLTEFELYKTSPEYKLRNYNFTVDEFKSIYWPEFYHRLLGRIMGLVFIIPFFYFLITKKLRDKKLQLNLVIIFLLGLLQGVVGWYMVKSGLIDEPSVSHYRLATHLFTALLLFGYIFLTAIPILKPEKNILTDDGKKLKYVFGILATLIILQIIYGAFVAGLKAGLFYPTFPKMGTDWIPETVINAHQQLGISGLTNSPYIVQFIHRWLGILLTIFAFVLYFKSRKRDLHPQQSNAIQFIVIAVLFQFLLGIITLLNLVPVSLGVIHQFGALIVLSSLLYTLIRFNYFRSDSQKKTTSIFARNKV